MTRESHARFNGPDVAAILAAAIGIFALGVVVLWSALSASFQASVFAIGKAWMPNADRVGPYSGKETLMLLSWLGSWLALHFALRRKHLDARPWFALSLGLVLVALVLIWPPVWHWLK